MIWVWIIGSIFSIIVGACLAEICSKLPNAGSVYNWAGELAPRKYSPISSYVTGWLNFLGATNINNKLHDPITTIFFCRERYLLCWLLLWLRTVCGCPPRYQRNDFLVPRISSSDSYDWNFGHGGSQYGPHRLPSLPEQTHFGVLFSLYFPHLFTFDDI